MSERRVVKQLRRQGFRVLTRRQWGSRHLAQYQWRRVHRRFVGPADHAFAHITVTNDTGNAKADALTIERIGQDRFGTGWSYNWGIHKSTKTIIVGQHMGAAGAHTINDKKVAGFPDNLNYWGHAIAFIAQPGDGFDDWCRSAVAAIIRAEKKHGDMKDKANLHPHSKFAWKDCPCDPYRNSIPKIERLSVRQRKPDNGTLLFATHNQGDKADSPNRGWDVQALTERSRHEPPNWALRFEKKGLKGLAIDWNPDEVEVHKRGSRKAHPGVKRVTPPRGTLWIEGVHVPTGRKVAFVCSHRINDPDGDRRSQPDLRRVAWWVHSKLDRSLVRGLKRKGYIVFYGGDVNHRTAPLNPLERVLDGRYDALAYTKNRAVKFVKVRRGTRLGSDHARFTAVFNLSGVDR